MFSCFGKTKKQNLNAKFKKPYYSFKSCKSGRVLDMSQQSSKNSQAIIYDQNKGDSQKFIIHQKGPDFILKCRKNNLYLTVEGPQNGARVYGTTKHMGPNQRFRLEKVVGATNKYVIYTFFGKVLDVMDAKTENGS